MRDRGRARLDDGSGNGLPWETGDGNSTWLRLWRTWRDSLFRPVPFFRSLSPRGGYRPALAYAAVVGGAGLFFVVHWWTLRRAVAGGQAAASALSEGVVALAFGLALYPALLFLVVAAVHLGFRAIGAGHQGYEGTFRALAYATGPAVLAAFPVYGPMVGAVWGIVLSYIALREVHRTTALRGALGCFLPFATLLLLGAAFSALLGLLT